MGVVAALARRDRPVNRARTCRVTTYATDSIRMTPVALVVNDDSWCKKRPRVVSDTNRSFASTHKCHSSSGLDRHFPANNASLADRNRVLKAARRNLWRTPTAPDR